ncbi:DUF899 domain-containing protein [Fodinicurvata halophila]|uniref:DUF899 domain-containing protein n=1 Tax=Fodinicurvata halophila TaxID=1419723 RepID=A0ABV8UPP6_9PROT
MKPDNLASREDWLAARKAHLEREKELTRLHEQVMAERRQLPWVRIETDYRFDSETGAKSLVDLFDGRKQLIVYHFMFAPGWQDGCDGCSFLADHFDGPNRHLKHHDVSLVAVSRAPLAEFLPFKHRMGWNFEWVSSHGSAFNYDFGASFTPEQVAEGKPLYNFGTTAYLAEDLHGLSIFVRDGEEIFHSYSTYARGGDILLGAHHFLDMTPKGRNEQSTMDWVRLHDRYEETPEEEGELNVRCHN